MTILVLRLSALGDVAMTIPAIYSVARTYPQHSFLVATAAFTARLFQNASANVRVLPLPKSESRGVVGTMRLARKLTKMQIDAVADLHNVLRSWICIPLTMGIYDRAKGTLEAMFSPQRLKAMPKSSSTLPHERPSGLVWLKERAISLCLQE